MCLLKLTFLLWQIPLTDLNSVTVPGAAAGWLKTIEEFGSGKLSMREILDPAIRLAREGVPQHELSSNQVRQMALELPRGTNAFEFSGRLPNSLSRKLPPTGESEC